MAQKSGCTTSGLAKPIKHFFFFFFLNPKFYFTLHVSFVWFINGEPSDPQIWGANRRNGGPEPGGGDNRRDRFRKEHSALSDSAPQRLNQVWNHRCHSASSSRCSFSRQVGFQGFIVLFIKVANVKSFILCLVSWNVEEMKRD